MRLVADLHTHTVASGHAYSTLHENLQAAKARGLEMMAMTDHGPTIPGGPHIYHFGNLRVLPDEFDGIKILRGVEANIVDREGSLDLPAHYLNKLDIVLAGLHWVCSPEGDVDQNTRAVVRAMQNPFVDAIVHPGNPEFLADPERMVEASLRFGVALEVNNSSFLTARRGSKDNCQRIAKLAAEAGSLLIVGSDAHWHEYVGRLDLAFELILEAGVKPEQVLNTSVDKIQEYLAGRRAARAARLG